MITDLPTEGNQQKHHELRDILHLAIQKKNSLAMHQFGILASHHIFSTNPTEQRTSLHFEPWRSQAETHESHQSPSLELSVSAPKGLPDQLPNDLCKGGLLSVQIHQQKLDPPQPSKKQSSRKPVTTATAVQLRPLGGDKMATKVAKRSKHSSSPRCISTTPRRDRTMKSRVWSPLLRSKHHDTNRAVTSHPEKNKTLWKLEKGTIDVPLIHKFSGDRTLPSKME